MKKGNYCSIDYETDTKRYLYLQDDDSLEYRMLQAVGKKYILYSNSATFVQKVETIEE